MIRQAALVTLAVFAVSACNGPVRDGIGGSGASPANFGFRSDDQNALALIAAAEDGNAVTWKVSERSFGSVTPTPVSFKDRAGRPCRGLSQSRARGGEVTTRDVTACKGGDGTWVVTDMAIDRAD